MKNILITILLMGVSMHGSTVFAENLSVDLLYKIDALQKEVSALRGQVDELQHDLQELQKKQRDQYMDLDKRMLGLTQPAGADGSTAADLAGLANEPTASPTISPNNSLPASPANDQVVSSTAPAVSEQPQPAAPAIEEVPISSVSELNEKTAYDAAFALITQKKYHEAEVALSSFVKQFPQGQFTPNAYYWLGEMYVLSPNLPEAKNAFEKVVKNFPSNRKVPDAMYKLGVVAYQMGNLEEAKSYFEQVISEYGSSTAANLAQQYLRNF